MAKLIFLVGTLLLLGAAQGRNIASEEQQDDYAPLSDEAEFDEIPLDDVLSDEIVDDPAFGIAASSCENSASFVRRVFVYRRPLAPLKYIVKIAALAHSGLILQLANGKECVLEYMGDGKAHLYDANYVKTGWSWLSKLRKVYSLRFTDYLGDTYSTGVTRQYYGTALPSSRRVTPAGVKGMMSRVMGSNYNLFTNNCHLGQERTRRALGLTVDHPYIFPYNKDQLCRLVRDRTRGQDLSRYMYNPYISLLVSMCHLTG